MPRHPQQAEPDLTFVDRPKTQVKAGDVGEDDEASTVCDPAFRPYCFKLKTGSAAGALSAVKEYTPWWRDVNMRKNPWKGSSEAVDLELADMQKKFNDWTNDRAVKDKRAPTHVAMNSGTLNVPLGPEEDEFLEYYAKCLLAGRKMYFVEQLNYADRAGVPVFRLFMDLDFKQLKPISGRGVEGAALVCARTVARFFPGRPSQTIVACTTYKNCTNTDAAGTKINLVKTGVHLYWPAHYVTPLQCLHIRESIVAALLESFGMRSPPEQNSWEDVVDKSVYGDAHGGRGSGLRMIGSFKTEKCGACNGKGTSADGNKCRTCRGDRRVDDMDSGDPPRPGRPYMMFCVLGPPTWIGAAAGPRGAPVPAGTWALSPKGPQGGDQQVLPPIEIERSMALEAEYQKSMHRLVLDTKLRTTITETSLDNGFDLPPGAPLYLAPAPGKRVATGTGPKRGEKHVEHSSPEYQAAQSVVREAFGDLYANVVVRSLGAKPKHYTVNVTGTNCRYCQNIGREHSSNNIYFTIDLVTGKKAIAAKATVAQRCYDSGDLTPEMRYGRCQEYTSQPFDVPSQYIKILWPDAGEGLSAFGQRQAPSAIAGTYLDGAMCKRHIAALEDMAKKLWQASWTAPQGLQGNKRSNEDIAALVPVDDRDLGSKGLQAFSDLGFEWADKLIAGREPLEDASATRPAPLAKTVDGAQKILFKALRTVCLVMTTVPNLDIFAKCVSVNDFLRPSQLQQDVDAEHHEALEMPTEGDFAVGGRKRPREPRVQGTATEYICEDYM
jgi:hypothetical protein